MIVVSFSGTSGGDVERVAQAIEIVAGRREQQPIVVVSALDGVTSDLVAASEAAQGQDPDRVASIIGAVRQRHEDVARRLVFNKSDFIDAFLRQLDQQIDEIKTILSGIALLGEITPRGRDKVISIGEKLSSVLLAYSMRIRTLPAQPVSSEELIWTDDRFGGAEPLMDLTRDAVRRVLLPLLARDRIPVMGGSIGRTRQGATTTLGRYGADYSAAVVGAALGADEVQIWTDVDCLMTCDPRLVSGARIIERLSFAEAAELAGFGAKLHPRTLEPAVIAGIPVRVLNTHNPSSRGTLITREGDPSGSGPRSIARKTGITIVHVASNKMLGVHGFLAKLFGVFDQLAISVDVITTSEISVTVTIDDRHNVEELENRLNDLGKVELLENQSIVAVVGTNLKRESIIGARVFEALRGMRFQMVSLSSSGLNLSIVVPDAHSERAVQALHAAFFEDAANV
ncbi:MAG: lysine-sensitive aspartokinase 3 [Acidobacteria bacterium]|nr:MAG: lysine-sensitive aspartokinase 3 [Acidobacteriota bacterium]